ncbi:retrovirus-related pol polyprotein from transposon TNT 1-94 [Tanacetum coccineum]
MTWTSLKLYYTRKADAFKPTETLIDVFEPQDITTNEVEPSPTIISSSVRVIQYTPIPQDKWSREKHIDLVNIIVYMGLMVYQMDVKSTFLNGKISKEVYVQPPPRFESSEFPNHVCKLDKALYGLKQASKAWYETLSIFLIQHKFVRGIIDNTLFTYKTKSDVIIIQVCVDDG